jgi:steroid delta-isomerase-like uncharacterized protein
MSTKHRAALQPRKAPKPETVLDRNKALVRRQFEELINHKSLEALEDLAPDFVDHQAPPEQPPGPEGVRQWITHLHQVCPDLQVTIEDIVADGDKVVVRNTWRGTHTGPLFGIPATGKPFTLTGIVLWRIEGGKLRERWALVDRWGLHQQLGVA